MEHIHIVEFTCLVLSVLLISLKTFFFSRHEAILNNAFENHRGITRDTIKMILSTAYQSLPPAATPSDTHTPTLKVRSVRYH